MNCANNPRRLLGPHRHAPPDIADSDTFLKAKRQSLSSLADNEKVAIEAGDILQATNWAPERDHRRFAGAQVNGGAALAADRFVYPPHRAERVS